MASSAFSAAERALHIKRRSFSKEITVILDEAKLEAGISKESFDEKKAILSNTGMKLLIVLA